MELAVRINPIAITDIREIIAYIAEDNPEAAAKIRNAIYSKIETPAVRGPSPRPSVAALG